MTSQIKCDCVLEQPSCTCRTEEEHARGLQASAAKQRIDAQATAVPPAVGEFAVHEIDRLSARLAKYEDAEGRPVVDAQRLLDWNRSQPEPRPIVVGREYQVAEACARLNQPASGGDERAAWTVRKPTEEGAYWIRGNGLEADALVQVKHEEGELWCNLHVSYIEPVFEYGYTIEQLSSEFEWLGPLHARAAFPVREAVAEGLAAVAIELCDAVENKADMPINKWALKYGYLVNKVRGLAAAPSAVSQEQGE